jgi:hypothetical protein
MKILRFTIIILILNSLNVRQASAQKYNSFVGLRYGAALPMGELASHQFGEGGYALLGKCFGLEAAWFINPKLGFGIDYSTAALGFASGFYADDYKESEPSYNSVDLLSGPYSLKTYMAGAYYKIKLSPRFYSSFKLMGGIFQCTTPDQLYGVVESNIQHYFWKTGSLDRKFSFLTGASIEFRLYEYVSLLLQADFTYAQLAFQYSTGSTSGYTDNLKMPVFKLQPGINIHF